MIGGKENDKMFSRERAPAAGVVHLHKHIERLNARITELKYAIKKAPHAMSCLSRAEWASVGHCDCWKRDVLKQHRSEEE
jgi:hypothetical protein